jgi:hypothetical protein
MMLEMKKIKMSLSLLGRDNGLFVVTIFSHMQVT